MDEIARILEPMKRIGVVLILIFAFFGIADSAYLAEHEANGTPLICNIQSLSGCNVVAESEYSRLFGIPLAEYGVVFYSIIFIIAAIELIAFNRLLRRVLQGMSLIGVLASLYFTFIQTFVIEAFCIYCLASAITALLIFICASFIEPIRNGVQKNPPADPIPPPMPPPYLRMPPAP